MVIQINS